MVETDGLAFPVKVHYEKQPAFCANCKLLGHTLQNCMKLNFNKNQEPMAKGNKKTIVEKHQCEARKEDKVLDKTTILMDAEKAIDTEDVGLFKSPHNTHSHNIENVATEIHIESVEKNGTKKTEFVPSSVISNGNVSHPKMVLYNSFDMLNIESDFPSGEAFLEGQVDHNRASKDKPLQSFVAGPSVSSGSESFLKPSVMPQPITTYHSSLSADKSPILEPVNALVHTAVVCSSEARRSVDILKKKIGGIVLLRSMSLTLFVHQQLETKSKRSRQRDKLHQKTQVVFKLDLNKV